MNPLPSVLTIAGSDSGGGAGIQADLKTIQALGCYGASAITALTAQNTVGVAGIEPSSERFVELQIKTVCNDINIKAAKTGMLFSAPIIRSVIDILKGRDFPLVVDPVGVATSGAKLLKDDAIEAMKDLFPIADLITPNIPETELFSGVTINSREDIFKAIEVLQSMGANAVLIKGGHFDSVAATDWLGIKGQQPIPLMQQRVKTNNSHGTGCTLSAAIASGLAKGLDMVTAITEAQKYLNLALRASYDLGEGSGPPNHSASILIDRARCAVLDEIYDFCQNMKCIKFANKLIPDSGLNLGKGLPFANGNNDIAALTGNINVASNGEILVSGYPRFDGARKVSLALAAARKKNANLHCVCSIVASDFVFDRLESLGFYYYSFEANNNLEELKNDCVKTLEWGISEATSADEKVDEPLFIYDSGDCDRPKSIWLFTKDLVSILDVFNALLDTNEKEI